jgi:hypothetical protein
MCEGDAIYPGWMKGSLLGACIKTPHFNKEAFPLDHLRDIFESLETAPVDVMHQSVPLPGPITLLVTRERGEHANFFHSSTDWLNAFIALHVAGVIDGRELDPVLMRRRMKDVQVLMLDSQRGPFDEHVYRDVFSPHHEVLRVSQLKLMGKREANSTLPLSHSGVWRIRRAIFVPPGYTSFFFAGTASPSHCLFESKLMHGFRRFMLGAFNIQIEDPREEEYYKEQTRPLRVSLISRRPYNRFVEHSFVGRQIDNEPELISVLSSVPDVNLTRHDFAQTSFREQLEIMSETDILIGMHGAALTGVTYLPDHAAVIELWPNIGIWRVFEHITHWSGLAYFRWENTDPAKWRKDDKGDYTIINATAVKSLLSSARRHVLSKFFLKYGV